MKRSGSDAISPGDPKRPSGSPIGADSIRSRCEGLLSHEDPQYVWNVLETTWYGKRKEENTSVEAQAPNQHAALVLAAALGYQACRDHMIETCGKDAELPPLPSLPLSSCTIAELEELLHECEDAMECEHEGTTYSVEKKPRDEKVLCVEALVKHVSCVEGLRKKTSSG